MGGMAVPYSRTIFGNLPWYSVLIVTGIAAAVWLAGREEKRLALPTDSIIDLALVAVPAGIVGARLYYVLMRWELFADHPVSVFYVWQGGLGIYGGIIGGAAACWFYARKKRLSFASIADAIAPGLLLAQAIGRWGNYFNMEAYGVQITEARLQFFPLAVYIPAHQAWFAATFFYESVWSLLGFLALWRIRTRQFRRGGVFAWYLLIYGSGRFVIEQLRQDSLYIGSLRASQWLSFVLCLGSVFWLVGNVFNSSQKKKLLPFICAFCFVMRWTLLANHSWYAVLLLIAGIISLWYKRECRKAIAWILLLLILDGFGLIAAIGKWPFEILANGLHAALCSATLPVSIWALCTNEE